VFPQKYGAVEKLEISEIKGNCGDRKCRAEQGKLFVFGPPLSNRSGNDSREQISTSRREQDLILITRVEEAIPVIEE
jgi:hypothetical protein